MKKILAILICTILFGCTLSACSKSKTEELIQDEKIKPTSTVDEEKILSDESFTGDFNNDDYTAHIEKSDNNEMIITIESSDKNTKWVMSGYFGYESSRVSYENAVKTINSGKETEYEKGEGRIQFTNSDSFTWKNNMENINDDVFVRTKQ